MMRDTEAIKGKSFDRAVLKRAWRFAKPYHGMIYGFLATIVVDALLTLVPPLLFRQIIDTAITDRDRKLAWTLAGISVAAALGDAALSIAQRWWSARIGEGLIYELRSALFDHVQRMPVAFFTRTQTGALISRLNNDVIGAQSAVTGTLGSVVSNVILLSTTLTTMFLLEWRLTLLALLVLPAFVVPARRVGRRLQVITREQMNTNAGMNATMTERFNVSGAMLVKLFGRYDDEAKGFSERAGRVRDLGVKSAMVGRIFFVALGLVAAIGTAVIYGLGAQLVISGAITVGTLVAMATFTVRVYQPLTQLTNARVDLMTALVSFERVFEVLDMPVAIEDKPGAVELSSPEGAIEFDHVEFAYPTGSGVAPASLELSAVAPSAAGGVTVLRDIDLAIKPGQLVALVGPSGAGKTTLASLVPRLYDVSRGSIRVDGVDVRDLSSASLHGAVGVVSQDPHLFHESVADNLRYAKPGVSYEQLVEACKAAQIHDVIAALPDGYDTVVGERGYRLSGGEKQRVAIARMLLKDPAIVILDEATSHLDSENEALVQAALERALVGRTSIVIAHRLSTIKNADLIVVVDGGRIVERGRHDDLLAAGGLYADLYHTLVRDRPVDDDE